MKFSRTIPTTQGGGGTNMRRNPPPMGGCEHKNTMGTGLSKPIARGVMGDMAANRTAKGVIGRG